MSKNLPEISDELVIRKVIGRTNYLVSTGAIGTKFLSEIRDNKKIFGIKCPSCSKVYIPPKTHCPACFAKMTEWVELSGKGSLTSYTIVYYKEPYMVKEPPFAYGVIQMDGADTGWVHFLGQVDLDKIKIGMRLEPVFKTEREGSILDIDHFKPSS